MTSLMHVLWFGFITLTFYNTMHVMIPRNKQYLVVYGTEIFILALKTITKWYLVLPRLALSIKKLQQSDRPGVGIM